MERSAPVEVRFAEGRLSGPVVTYGEIAQSPKGPERFEPRAFVSGVDTASLVLQHDGRRVIAEQPDNLLFEDTPVSLDLRAELPPDGAEARLVRRKALRGLSAGFIALEERQQDGVRVITRAHLHHVALVDVGAYPGSKVELRQLDTAAFVGAIPYQRLLQCECVGDDCGAVEFAPGSLDHYIDGDTKSIAVSGGGFASVLASTARGTLTVARLTGAATRLVGATRDAAQARINAGVQVVVEQATTAAARGLVLDALSVPLYVRPMVRFSSSDFTDQDGVRRIERADIRGWLIKSTPNDLGHLPVAAAGTATGPVPEPMRVEPEQRRRARIWL